MQTKLEIRVDGDPILRKISKPVEQVTASERMFVQAMIVTMHAYEGIGLAAPQVGVSKRIIVVDIGKGQTWPLALINPQVVDTDGSCDMEEGCLSVPEKLVHVKRAQKIVVEYLDIDGQPQRDMFVDLMARVILHEIDHLDGKLIVDYL